MAAIALRSLIWTPQIYQALGPSYASRSIDKICNLAHLRVDPVWQGKGSGAGWSALRSSRRPSSAFLIFTRRVTPHVRSYCHSGKEQASASLPVSTTWQGSRSLLLLQLSRRAKHPKALHARHPQWQVHQECNCVLICSRISIYGDRG